jgi:hypothetical protein
MPNPLGTAQQIDERLRRQYETDSQVMSGFIQPFGKNSQRYDEGQVAKIVGKRKIQVVEQIPIVDSNGNVSVGKDGAVEYVLKPKVDLKGLPVFEEENIYDYDDRVSQVQFPYKEILTNDLTTANLDWNGEQNANDLIFLGRALQQIDENMSKRYKYWREQRGLRPTIDCFTDFLHGMNNTSKSRGGRLIAAVREHRWIEEGKQQIFESQKPEEKKKFFGLLGRGKNNEQR